MPRPKSGYYSYCVVLMPFGHCCVFKGPLWSEVLPGVCKLILVLGFRFSLVFHVYPSPFTKEGSEDGGPMPVEVGWCPRDHSPRQPRGLAACNCKCGAPIQCTSEDISDLMPRWYYGWGGALSAAVPLATSHTGAAKLMP
jgi:hypothetical protein